jgi:hypothetical protein
MRTYIAALLFAISSVYASGSFAQDYKWYLNAVSNVFYDSPAAVCASYPTTTNGDGTTFTPAGPQYLRDGWFYCTERVVQTNGNTNVGVYNGYAAVRVGDSCPTGSTYIPLTGVCTAPEPDKCEAKAGHAANFASTAALPGSACIDGCAAALYVNTSLVDTKGNRRYYYDGNYTGNQCSGSNPTGYNECNLELDCTKDNTDPEVDASNECKPGADEVGPDGRTWKVSNCTKQETTKQDGEDECNWGLVGAGAEGNWTCVVKPPKSTSTKTDTETKTTTNTDGSKDTKQTITTTETKCTGVNSCTTTTTTTNNNSHTNADGSAGDSSSSCKGAKCPSGNGDGEGEGEEEEGDDDIAGPTKQLIGKASQGFGEAEAEWQTKIDAGRQQLDGLINQYSALFSGAFDLNMGTGGGGLPCLDTPISALGQNANIKICPADYEDQLVYLKYILLACATILAGFIILRN